MNTIFGATSSMVLDPIMAIDEQFRADRAAGKLNLVVGVYQNEEGRTPVLASVKAAEEALIASERSKAYLPIAGEQAFVAFAESLLLGHSQDGRSVGSIQTPGSTGALRIAAELIKDASPAARVWIGTPAYSNHAPIFAAAGMPVEYFRYFDAETGGVAFDEMLTDLERASAGDVVILHGCCHNPSGADLSPDQWLTICAFLQKRALLPMIDAAYLGLAEGLAQDTAGLRALIAGLPEAIIAMSFSKNFALYRERVGLLSFVCDDASANAAFVAGAKAAARALYTSPPSHGAQVIATVLADPALASQWLQELDDMRAKLMDVRMGLDARLQHGAAPRGVIPRLAQNRGMFTMTRLDPYQVERLRVEHHIYLLDNGRLSLAGLRQKDIDRVSTAIETVTAPGAGQSRSTD